MSGAARILIVDDEPFNVDYIQQELDDLGYETSIATNGREALERVAADPPDLILLDVMMPDIDGITVCRMLKDDAATRLIPIVIMTALDAQEDRIRGIEAGADDFLTKPVDDRELVARIRTALKQKQVVDEAVEELRSASDRLERLGPRTLEASILVLELRPGGDTGELPAEAIGFLAREYVSAFEGVIREAGGEITASSESELTALFQDAPRATEAAAEIAATAAEKNAATSATPLEVEVAVASGAVTVKTVRVEGLSGARWELSVEGEAANEVRRLLATGEAELRGKAEPAEARAAQAPAGDGDWWPAEFAGIEPELRRAWDVEGDILATRTLSGKSGALVYGVDLACRDFSGQAILKLAEAADPSWGQVEESDRHLQAVAANTAYAAEHLPQIVHALQHERQLAVLATIAARGLEYSVPWAECPYGQQLASVPLISRGILESWNSDYRLSAGLHTPSELLRRWLGYRLDPQEGRIHTFLGDAFELTAADETFIFDGHWYPNPLAFSADAVELPERLKLRAVAGRLHGDLHGHNVLVRSPSESEVAYYLIDLAMYEDDSFLLYDHAYFEVAQLVNVRADAEPYRWLALLDATSRDASPDADDLGLVQLVAALRQEVFDWIDRHEANRLSYLESQYAMARVAAGLNFVHKALPPQPRLLALLYSAVALKGYLKFHDVDWPKRGPVLTTPA